VENLEKPAQGLVKEGLFAPAQFLLTGAFRSLI
jgi:hypothetical protein